MYLNIEHLHFGFNNTVLFKDFQMNVTKGSVTAILGDSGKGKTTLLRLISGLETPSEGVITLDDRVLFGPSTNLDTSVRQVGLVFQDYSLFPHMSVAENIAYGVKKSDRKLKKKIVAELLEMMELNDFHKRKPYECSGGQQQRIAIARALASQPKVLCLDEPFSNLDQSLKERMRSLMKDWFKSKGVTVIMVTHDKEDAQAMADQIITL
jgi:iron(III) transport system ATP-binding protein